MSMDFKYKYKKDENDEIISLKNYIQKMNYLVRKSLNLKRVPTLEEGFEDLSKIAKNIEDIPNLKEIISQWLNDLLKVDYINPLITLYEKHIKENEILVQNYNKTLSELNQLKSANGFGQNNNKYQQLYQQYTKLSNNYDSLKTQYEKNKQKVNEMSNNKNLLENDNLKLKNDLAKVEYELKTYKESNKRYENMLKNNY